MTHAIRKHMRDFVAILVLAAVAIGIAGYILSHQRLRFPLIEDKPFVLKATFANAQAVNPGQGQTVRVSGMRVGDITDVELEDGNGIVTMELDPEHDKLVHEDATALLRPRTGLKDMFISLDPGSDDARVMEENEAIPVEQTQTDVNPDEILSALDTDTRAYFKLLISGAGGGLKGRSDDLRQVLRRLGPLQRDVAKLTSQISTRRRNLARLVTNYGRTVERLGQEDRSLSQLVRSSRSVFDELAQEDQSISAAVARLPSALRQTEQTLLKVRTLGETAKPAFTRLRPVMSELEKANASVEPLAREGTPIVRERVRPFVREARPYVRKLRPTAANLSKAQPDLRESFFELNRFFNMLAYNPNGREKLTGDRTRDLARDEGLLFWLGWVVHNTNSLFSTADAMGPYRRVVIVASCSTYAALFPNDPDGAISRLLLGLNQTLNDQGLCPAN